MKKKTATDGRAILVRERPGEYRVASADDLIAAARQALERRMNGRTKVSSPAVMKDFLRIRFANEQREIFVGIFLDTQHQVIEVVELAHGTIDGASVYPREVLKAALALNASAVIFSHGHPSGNPEPSAADRVLTDRLKQALQLVDIRVLDHFVIGGDSVVSFAERGWC